jgi:hypothetical protein
VRSPQRAAEHKTTYETFIVDIHNISKHAPKPKLASDLKKDVKHSMSIDTYKNLMNGSKTHIADYGETRNTP